MNKILRNPWITIWTIGIFIGLVLIILITIFNVQIPFQCFLNNLITGLFGQYLAALGMLTAVSVAIMSWVYNQGINSRQKGFSDFRNATSDLNMNAVEMLQNLGRASTTHQLFLHEWAGATSDLVNRLNQITPGWKGWLESQGLEKKFQEYVGKSYSTLKNTGTFLSTDLVWMKIFAKNDKYIRDIVIGLNWLSLGNMATQTSKKLFQFFISIIALLIFGVILSIIEIIRGGNLNYNDTVLILIFIFLIVGHVIWLAQIIASWWKDQRSQEKYWESY
jgi:hypothetical protein